LVRVVGHRHRAVLHGGDRLVHAPDGHGEAGAAARQRGLEAELEGEVLLAVAVVVDVDLVERVRVQRVVVRAVEAVLHRLVIGDQGDVVAAAGLVAVEEVEVRGVHLGRARDERRLAVAGGAGGAGQGERGGGDERRGGERKLR